MKTGQETFAVNLCVDQTVGDIRVEEKLKNYHIRIKMESEAKKKTLQRWVETLNASITNVKEGQDELQKGTGQVEAVC